MGVREIERFLEQWQMEVKDLRRRMILAPTPRERERWYAILLLAQGWTSSATAQALVLQRRITRADPDFVLDERERRSHQDGFASLPREAASVAG